MGSYLRVFCRKDVPSLASLLGDAVDNSAIVGSRSGSPEPGWTWETVEVVSGDQQAPLPVELQRHDKVAANLLRDVTGLAPSQDRARVEARLAATVAAAEVKLSLIDDFELLFTIIDRLVRAADGLVYCDGDPGGFFDDPRGGPFLTLP